MPINCALVKIMLVSSVAAKVTGAAKGALLIGVILIRALVDEFNFKCDYLYNFRKYKMSQLEVV